MMVLQNDKLMIYDEYTFHRLIYASAFCNRYLWHHYDIQTFISGLIKPREMNFELAASKILLYPRELEVGSCWRPSEVL